LFDGRTVLGLDGRLRQKAKSEAVAGGEAASEESAALVEEIKEEKAAAGEEIEEEEQPLPPLQAGEDLRLHDLVVTQHFTQPPPRYSEASLVRALEKEGIGRPSTYAPIVQTIQERGYVNLINRRFYATELGMAATDILLQNFANIMDLKFTAAMEEDLDHVEEGKVDWRDLVERFYKPFAESLEKALVQAEPLTGRPAPNNVRCPQCGAEMVIRYSQSGAFFGCTCYPECQGTIPLAEEAAAEGAVEAAACPSCGAPLVLRRSRFGAFFGCSKYPECKQTLRIGRDGKPIIPPAVKRNCEICGSPMRVQGGKRGFSLVCGEEKCGNIKGIDRHGQVIDLPRFEGIKCDKCGAEMVTRLSRRGPFLSCSAFPKCRNAKPLPKDTQDKQRAAGDRAKGEE
ncbi:MAG: topoisomerase DNA-binding C4 zinc finger domain-containing protein, partial [Planctomycetota bacterium]|nr:topoisomerase DNA-binding C4 zinc finger domain-containing protein [Planctomycetota bacterium]